MRIPFGTQSYMHRSRQLSAQRMVNCYLEAVPSGKTAAAVVSSFGLADFSEVGTGPLRGALVVNDRLFVVSGSSLYSVASTGTGTSLGTIPNSDRVSMASDGTNVVIVTGGLGYIYNGSSVAIIADVDFPGASVVDFIDGFFVIIEPDSGRVWTNETAYDPTVWNALDFATAETAPDDLVGLIVDHREVFLFGKESFEVWYNSGDADFILQRTASGYGEIGLLSKFGCTKADNSVYLAAHDCTIRRLDGYTPVIISTVVVSQAIELYADKACFACSFIESGHTMIAFCFAEGTWIYDASTQLWHERQSYGLNKWRAVFAVRVFGKLLIGDSESNKIGEADPDTFAEFDEPLISSGTSPAIGGDGPPMNHRRLELVFERGVGTSGQAENPQVMLQWSDDDGMTWSSEYWRSLGRTGQYKQRAIWNSLGQARQSCGRVYRYSISDPCRRTLIMALLDAA
jgi:hypothetical protein